MEEAVIYYLIPTFAAIAFLASLTVYIWKPTELYLWLLSFYLLFDASTEAYTSYLAFNRQNNLLANGLAAMVSFCFYIYLCRAVIRSRGARNVLLASLIIFPVIFAFNIFVVQKSQVYQSISYSLGCLVVVSACIFYFWELFQSKHYVNLVREPAFWICSGLLFYCVCTFPVYGLINFVHVRMALVHVIVLVLDFVNILLYLSFTIAFLCRLKLRKSMLSS